MVHGNRAEILGAGALEQFDQLVRIKILCLPQVDDVLVSEF